MSRFARDDDFYEGIRTVLVEKGSKPNWKHSSLEAIPKEEVLEYFLPLKKEKILEL